MSLVRYARVGMAFLLALPSMVVTGLLLLVTAWASSPLQHSRKIAPYRQWALDRFAKWWNWFATRVLMGWLMGVRIEIEGPVPVFTRNESIAILANHPSSLAIPVFFWFITHRITSRFRITMKKQHRHNPIIGASLARSNSAVFIDREGGPAELAALRQEMSRALDQPGAVILYCDGRRPSEERIAASRVAVEKSLGIALPDFKHTLVPKRGGSFALVAEAGAKGRRVFLLTTAFNFRDERATDAFRAVGSTIHLRLTEATHIPLESERTFGLWLINRFADMNRWIETKRAKPR
ncbi:hypothetical protein FJZ48_01680 [Candidatus Uhrbacteria bacterium]|nr:hypothetical protein [Candidatus Uhrbacteria bacterium]